jgi:hypothetical protein
LAKNDIEFIVPMLKVCQVKMTYDKSSCEENEFKLSSDESEATGAQAQ